jgi:hypothetical protein
MQILKNKQRNSFIIIDNYMVVLHAECHRDEGFIEYYHKDSVHNCLEDINDYEECNNTFGISQVIDTIITLLIITNKI